MRRTTVLAIIVLAQFACVSLWFAGNGVMSDLIRTFHLEQASLGHLTSAVQFGFVTGTLLFAVFAIADRFSPSKVFLFSAILASACNLATVFSAGLIPILYGSRFLTGFFLAGIYPVGMKIAADYFDKDLGKALGYLLGALVLGTAFPHLLKSLMSTMAWSNVLIATSLFAIAGGVIIFLFVPDGPFRKKGTGFNSQVLLEMFKNKSFRSVAFGYFGHMWELYAFWTLVPFILAGVFSNESLSDSTLHLYSFSIIAIGSLACIVGGYISQRIGSYKVALITLTASGICCLISPILLSGHPWIVLIFLLFWGMMVIMDSPQFSTLIARSAPVENKASALTIVNCIGFSITIFSIQLLNFLKEDIPYQWLFIFLLPGPVFGVLALGKK